MHGQLIQHVLNTINRFTFVFYMVVSVLELLRLLQSYKDAEKHQTSKLDLKLMDGCAMEEIQVQWIRIYLLLLNFTFFILILIMDTHNS